ncbi:hypothetical protein VTK56DRAFT_1552 [Thermocarpiscus australiensis]
MLIKQPHPPPTATPQLHTHKNHHTYNSTEILPLATHVRVVASPSLPSRSTGLPLNASAADDSDLSRHRYAITLFYAHNRACEIYRSHDDFLALYRAVALAVALAVAPAGKKTPGPRAERWCRPACAYPGYYCCGCCRCRCYCSHADDRLGTMIGASLNCFLQGVIRQVREGNTKNGDVSARAAAEAGLALGWFLRRRLGDCGGR